MIGNGELLELLYTAPDRFASIRAVLRSGTGEHATVERYWAQGACEREETDDDVYATDGETVWAGPPGRLAAFVDDGHSTTHRIWLDPSDLIGCFDFAVEGETEVAGRRGWRVVATPRDTPEAFGLEVWRAAGPVELVVDAERGILLRDGHLHEMVEVAFDELLPDDLFRPGPPAGAA